MKIVGYFTGVGFRESSGRRYLYIDIEGLRVSVPDALGDVVSSLVRGRSYSFVVRHAWVRRRDGPAFPRLELLAVGDGVE